MHTTNGHSAHIHTPIKLSCRLRLYSRIKRSFSPGHINPVQPCTHAWTSRRPNWLVQCLSVTIHQWHNGWLRQAPRLMIPTYNHTSYPHAAFFSSYIDWFHNNQPMSSSIPFSYQPVMHAALAPQYIKPMDELAALASHSNIQLVS